MFHLTVESRTYNFVRAINRDPSFLVSSDFGTNWEFGGKLLTDKNVGYVNAYVKYSSNDTDRIDFIATEHHPKDFNNSIYHGYVKDGKTHRSDGTVVDDNIFDGNAPPPTALTPVFAGGVAVDDEPMTRCWTTDLAVVGRPHAIFTCRANDIPDDSNFNDHRFFYARFDGVTWHVHPLAKAGPGLWSWERDYVGGAAVDAQDRNIVYISTPIDPRDETSLARYEIFKGVTSDGGSSWKWDPITFNSTADNRRPVVARWNSDWSALLWCRGTIHHSTQYNMQIVGIIEPREGARATTSAR